MPRSARLDAPGVLHHIMIRGIERGKIFRTVRDREDFLTRLSTILPETRTPCYAWALLDNHAHLLLRSGEAGIVVVMRSLFCCWCVRELGESVTGVARRLGLTQPAVGYAVERGERLAKKLGHQLEP